MNNVTLRAPPLTLLLLVVLIALASLGIVYGLWSETLFIDGTATTGEVDARWTSMICNEFHTWPRLPQTQEDEGEFKGKNVGSYRYLIDGNDDRIFHFRIDNGYPSYAVDCQVHFQVEGTVPIIVRGVSIAEVSDNLSNCELVNGQQITLTCDQLTVMFTTGYVGAQIHPDDTAAGSLTVHVEQPAKEGAEYEFEVKACVAQWNEAPTAEECFAAAP
jgi:hypothetical protein